MNSQILADLHPYDGSEKQFRHSDPDRDAGLVVVAHLLRLPHPPSGDAVLYELSFYSGGIGILDRLAITLAADPTTWERVVEALRAKTPEDAANDPDWADDFLWLLGVEDALVSIREGAIAFINNERREFQSLCHIFFVAGSNVNGWTVLWGDDTTFNYYGYDQG